MTYRQGPDWCMTEPMVVDTSSVKSMSSDKEYRCPKCKRRVKMALYNYEPYGSRDEPKHFTDACSYARVKARKLR